MTISTSTFVLIDDCHGLYNLETKLIVPAYKTLKGVIVIDLNVVFSGPLSFCLRSSVRPVSVAAAYPYNV